MATEATLCVQRTLYPQTYMGQVYNSSKSFHVKAAFLPDDVRHAMGGELRAWFKGEYEYGTEKFKVFQRIPRPDDWPADPPPPPMP